MVDNEIYITISHCIYLNRYERHRVSEISDVEIHTTGISIPVWCKNIRTNGQISIKTDEPAEEVICQYIISSKKSDIVINVLPEGYKINISPENLKNYLKDKKDEGEERLMFTYSGEMKLEDKSYPVIHFVNIKDISALKETLTH